MRSAKNVWIDSVWLPTISYSAAKRAYHEYLDTMPSDKIMWGADCTHAEGIYGATETTRRCLAEVLAERVDAGNLDLADAERIGRQILRDNALKLFPQLRDRLWKHRGPLTIAPVPASARPSIGHLIKKSCVTPGFFEGVDQQFLVLLLLRVCYELLIK